MFYSTMSTFVKMLYMYELPSIKDALLTLFIVVKKMRISFF